MSVLDRARRRLARMLEPQPQLTPEPPPPDYAALADAAPGTRLNLGCGFDYRQGWVNIDLNDVHKPDVVADIGWLRPIEDGTAGYVLAQDVLEHVHRARCLTVLQEWNRVTRPGGLLEIRVPDVIALAQLMEAPQWQTLEGQTHLLQCMFGTQGYIGDYHYNGFTSISLRHLLEQAGFRIESLRHHEKWLFEVLARKVAEVRPPALLRVETDPAFIDAAYRDRLGREPDPEGRAYWLARLADGIPREGVLEALKED